MFGLPAFASMIMFGPEAYFSSVFAKFYGLDLVKLGVALTVIGVLDAFTDPLIGYLSDNYPTRWGRRKPWIVVGAFVVVVSLYFLLASPFAITLSYFVVWLFIFRLGQTFFMIPKHAMGVELTHDYGQRTRLYGYLTFLQNAGRLVFLLIPLLPFFASSAMTPEVFKFTFYVGLGLFPIAIWFFVNKIPERAAASPETRTVGQQFRNAWNLIRKNPPFLYYIVAQSFLQVGAGIAGVSIFLYFDVYLQIGEFFSVIGLGAMSAMMISAPIWLRIAKRFSDKRRLMVYSGMLSTLGTLAYAFLTPGEHTLYFFIAANVFAAFAYGGALIAGPSLFADVIDYGNWRTGQDSAASYVAINGIITKFEFSVAGGFAFVLMGLGGFDPSAEVITDTAIRNLKITNLGIPIILTMISIAMYWYFPITPRRQAIVSRRLRLREARQSAAAA